MWGLQKRNFSNKEALKIIVDAVKNYDMELKDRHFLIVYQEGVHPKTKLGQTSMNRFWSIF